ncbi:MAG TPA: DUF2946 family protein [Dongiaceae bacterium]|nr:DUF2946 family protein [Dongiaceae bacterium]
MGKRRQHLCVTAERARPGLLRQFGRLGAVLALTLQLLLPFLAMPQPASAQDAPMPGQTSTPGGDGALCEPGMAMPHQGQQSPMIHHHCPVCWALQQTGNLLPPSAPPASAPLVIAWVKAPAPDRDGFHAFALSPTQPRGPPFV